jgi:hypothetical protein
LKETVWKNPRVRGEVNIKWILRKQDEWIGGPVGGAVMNTNEALCSNTKFTD